MFCEPDTYRRDLLENLNTLEAVIHRAVITYTRLQLQSRDVQINPLQQHESLVTESTTLEANLNTYVKALDVGSVITESSGTKSDKHDTSSSSGTYIKHAVDADIRPVNDQVPFAETKDHNDSLIAQVNSKTVKNADLKAQIQEKVFANVALKNKLRKLKGNSVDTKFAKPSILRKPVLQPPRNQSAVRQLNAFKSERPNFSKPQFVLPKNSQEESYGLNDMVHNHYLEEARKKTQERNRNFKIYETKTTLRFLSLGGYEGRIFKLAGLRPRSLKKRKSAYEDLFQPLFDEYFNPPPCAVSPDPVAVAAPRPVDPAGSPLSTTIDQDVPSASTSPTNQEIQFQVTHQGVEEQIHGHQNPQFDGIKCDPYS
ncbi:hypothetical protein Tco_0434426 [Tanacetum coccineum]